MTLLLSMPGGSEWVIIGFFIIVFVILFPILTIVFYTKTRQLNKQLSELKEEKNILLKRLLEKV